MMNRLVVNYGAYQAYYGVRIKIVGKSSFRTEQWPPYCTSSVYQSIEELTTQEIIRWESILNDKKQMNDNGEEVTQ